MANRNHVVRSVNKMSVALLEALQDANNNGVNTGRVGRRIVTNAAKDGHFTNSRPVNKHQPKGDALLMKLAA